MHRLLVYIDAQRLLLLMFIAVHPKRPHLTLSCILVGPSMQLDRGEMTHREKDDLVMSSMVHFRPTYTTERIHCTHRTRLKTFGLSVCIKLVVRNTSLGVIKISRVTNSIPNTFLTLLLFLLFLPFLPNPHRLLKSPLTLSTIRKNLHRPQPPLLGINNKASRKLQIKNTPRLKPNLKSTQHGQIGCWGVIGVDFGKVVFAVGEDGWHAGARGCDFCSTVRNFCGFWGGIGGKERYHRDRWRCMFCGFWSSRLLRRVLRRRICLNLDRWSWKFRRSEWSSAWLHRWQWWGRKARCSTWLIGGKTILGIGIADTSLGATTVLWLRFHFLWVAFESCCLVRTRNALIWFHGLTRHPFRRCEDGISKWIRDTLTVSRHFQARIRLVGNHNDPQTIQNAIGSQFWETLCFKSPESNSAVEKRT